MRPMEWWRYRRQILNIRMGNHHFQVWCWGWQFIKAQSGEYAWRIDEVLFWRPLPDHCKMIFKGLFND